MPSSANNRFNVEYLAEGEQGQQRPMLTEFCKRAGVMYHRYSTELYFVPPEPGQHPRYIDPLFPLWNLFDLTPEGRTEAWMSVIRSKS